MAKDARSLEVTKITLIPILVMSFSFVTLLLIFSSFNVYNQSRLFGFEISSEISRNLPNLASETYLNQMEGVDMRIEGMIRNLTSKYPQAILCFDFERMQSPSQKFQKCSQGAMYKSTPPSGAVDIPFGGQMIGKLTYQSEIRNTLTRIFPPVTFLILALAATVALIAHSIVQRSIQKKIIAPFVRRLERSSRDQAISSLSRQVAHDIRSPLAALKMLSSLSGEKGEEENKLMNAAVTRIQEIAANLLTQSKSQQFSVERCELESSILEILQEKQAEYHALENIQWHFKKLPTKLQLAAYVHPVEFKRILSNLLNNSVEALGNGETNQQRGNISISLSPTSGDENFIEVLVEDDGVGIAPELLKRLGQEELSVGKSHHADSGTGLGVKHAKEQCELWGGTLEIESVLTKGTKIKLRLPRAL